MHYELMVNGLKINAEYQKEEIEEIFIPLLDRWELLAKEKKHRIFVFLAAPPGCGKTTLSLFLESLSQDRAYPIQAIGMDGFHYPNAYLDHHTMIEEGKEYLLRERKGSCDTFDKERLKEKIREGKNSDNLWPIYSRAIHDVVEDQIQLQKPIILLEGNYLLLNGKGWEDLIKECDDCVFLFAKEELLKHRLVERKMAGGMKREDAERFYEQSDQKNIVQVLEHHHPANITLYLEKNRIMKGENEYVDL